MYNDGNLVLFCIFLVCVWLFARLSKFLFDSYISPLGLYAGIWLLSLALFYIGIVRYYDLELTTVLAFGVAILTFAGGAVIARALIGSSAMSEPVALEDRHLRAVVVMLFLIGIFGTALYYLRLHSLIGIDSLWLDPRRVRYEETLGDLRRIGWIGLARTLLIPCFVLTVIALRIARGGGTRLYWVIAGISFLGLLPSTSRTTMISLVVWSLLAMLYLKQIAHEPISLRKYAPLVVGGILVFASYFVATNNALQKSFEQTYGPDVSNGPPGIQDIVHYMVSSLPAFDALIRSSSGATSDASLTFGAIARILNEINPNAFAYPDYVQPMVYVPLPTNIYTYLDVFYLDFGWLGVITFPFVIGLGTTTLFLRMLRSPSIAKVYLTSLFGLCLFQSVGVNRFGSFQTWMWIFIPLAMLKAVSILRRPATSMSAADVPRP